MKLVVIIAGSRYFTDYALFKKKVDFYLQHYLAKDITIISGGARGPDNFAIRYAQERGIHCKVMKAEWHRFGRKAGYLRNVEMSKIANALIAFWDGETPGTSHMIDTMKKKGTPIRIVRFAA